MKKCIQFLVVLVLATSCAHAETQAPNGVYLTWRDDPRTTMIINWITSHTDDDDIVEYRETSCQTCAFKRVNGTHQRLNVNDDYQVHRLTLTNLRANTSYSFRLNIQPREVYTFQTMSEDLSNPTRFILGGDVFSDSLDEIGDRDRLYAEMNRLAASYDPFCVFLGGDLSYAGNTKSEFNYWLRFFEIWWKSMRGSNNRLIPMVTALGNHELEDADRDEVDKLLYFDFFPPVNRKGYYKLNFGSTMSILMLDTGNVNKIGGVQTTWLDANLRAEKNRDHLFAIYHHPAYPSIGSFTGSQAKDIRKNWSPLFEKYGLDAAFENHSHHYKRTYPLKRERRANDGIVYVGDGAWGVHPRISNGQNNRFFEKSASARHFILLELHNKRRHFRAISSDNEVIDEWIVNDRLSERGSPKSFRNPILASLAQIPSKAISRP